MKLTLRFARMNCSGMRKHGPGIGHRSLSLVVMVLVSCVIFMSPVLVVSAKGRDSRPNRKCKYEKSRVRWGLCDPTVRVKTKVASLVQSKSRQGCPETRTYTKACDVESITYNGCEYIQVSDWSECDKDTMTKTRTLELRIGTTQLCDNTRLESRECGGEVAEVNTSVAKSEHHKKGKKKDRKRNKKARRRKRKRIVMKKGCPYRKGRWGSCDEKTRIQTMKLKLKRKSTTPNCDQNFLVTRKCDPSAVSGNKRNHKRKNSRKRKKKDKKKSSKRTKKRKDENEDVSQIPPRLTELYVVPYTDFVVVSWKPPQEEETGRPVPVDGYLIGYGRGFPDVYSVQINASAVSHTIENLEPGGEYVISIRAMNQAGVGQAVYDTVMTREDDKGSSSPLLPPVGVVSSVLSSKAINVSWEDLSIKGQQTPVDRSYFLRYRRLSHLTQKSTAYADGFKIVQTESMFRVVSDLQPYTKYEFAVLTSSGTKNSSWSLMVWNITDQDVPEDAPTVLTYIFDPDSPKQVILTWQPPKKPNGIITGYDIFYQTSDSEEPPPGETKVSVEGNRLSTVLTFLLPGVPYDLSVRARNVKGVGPTRTIQKYTLPGDPVPVPITLKVTRLKKDAKAARLTWDIPPQVDVEILGFVILYTPESKSALVHWQVESRIGKNLRMTVLDHLEAETKYAFKIQAHTSAGFGPESNIVHFQTGEVTPTEVDSTGPPTNLRIKVLSATSMVASWQDPQTSSGLEIKMPNPNPVYQLRYRSLDPEPANYKQVTVYFPSFYLHNLSPLTQYEFSVCALKCEVMTQWTKPVRKTTFALGEHDMILRSLTVYHKVCHHLTAVMNYNELCKDFSQRPLKVEVKGQKHSPSIAILSWQPHSGANFKEYVIMYTTDPSKPHKHWVQKSAVGLETKRETFYDLNSGTTYFFFVQAMTDVGFGPRSKVVSYTTPANKSSSSLVPPQKLEALMISATSVVLRWQDPDFVHLTHRNKKNPKMSRTYTMRYQKPGAKSSGYKFLNTPSQSLFLVTLDPATEYEFSVRVNHQGQHSAWSSPVTNSTFEAAPASAPRNITVEMDNKDPTSVLLTWQPPQLPNGDITGYMMFYTTNQKMSLRKVPVESVSGNRLRHRISFLKPHKTYYFKMRAHNKKGYSPLSETTVYKTPKVIGPPPNITSVETQPDNPYNALVQWEPPVHKKRKIQYFTLTYSTEDGRDRVVEEIAGTAVETVIEGLQASTTYHLSLQAFYSKGAGPHSAIAKYSIPKELLPKMARV